MKRFNPFKPNAPATPPRPKPLEKGTIPSPAPVVKGANVPTLTENNLRHALELRFPQHPDPTLLALFHATKGGPREQEWHWHRRGKYWYVRRNDATRAYAALVIAKAYELAAVSIPTPTPEATSAPEVPENNIISVQFAPAPLSAPVPTLPAHVPAWRARFIRPAPAA